MESSNLISYIIFAFITSITPGPNNLLLLSCGKSLGFKKSIPIMSGIVVGFTILLIIGGYGIGKLIFSNYFISMILKIVSSIWLIYLAFIMRNLSSTVVVTPDIGIGFFMSLLLQFSNPKAWIMAINGAAAFLPEYNNIHLSVFIFVLLFVCIGTPCMFVWVLAGDYMSKFITSSKNALIGNILFILMLLVVIMMWI